VKDKIKMNGIVAYIVETADGRTKLIIDDVISNNQPPTNWRQEIFCTSNTYDSEVIENMNLSKEQYAEIGENIILRLLAMNGALK
jgi:hypothetical protein